MTTLLAGTAAAAYAYDRVTTGRILPGVRIAGIDVSGMTRQEAMRAIRDRARSALARTVTIHAARSAVGQHHLHLGRRRVAGEDLGRNSAFPHI